MKDFLQNFPRTHEDRSHIKPIDRLDCNGEVESVKAVVIEKKLIPTRGGKKFYEITIQDEEENQAFITLFNNQRAYKSYEVGQRYIITGKPQIKYRKTSFSHPDATKTSPPDIDEELSPLSPLIGEEPSKMDNLPHPVRRESIREAGLIQGVEILEKILYHITKNNTISIDEHNLLYLAFLKKELSDR